MRLAIRLFILSIAVSVTSCLDSSDINEEKQILNKIFDVYKEKTIIYISHKKEIISMFKQKYKIERIK